MTQDQDNFQRRLKFCYSPLPLTRGRSCPVMSFHGNSKQCWKMTDRSDQWTLWYSQVYKNCSLRMAENAHHASVLFTEKTTEDSDKLYQTFYLTGQTSNRCIIFHVFIFDLFNDTLGNWIIYSVRWQDDKSETNFKDSGSGRDGNFNYYSRVRLWVLRKPQETSVRIARLEAEVWTTPPEYEVPTIMFRRSVTTVLITYASSHWHFPKSWVLPPLNTYCTHH